MTHYEMQERNWQAQFNSKSTFGERCADRVAKSGGSWSFLIGLGVVLLTWILLNTILAAFNGPDWYRYFFDFIGNVLLITGNKKLIEGILIHLSS